MPKDDASLTSAGRLFHNFTPRYEKPLCPFKDVFLGILRSVDVLRRVRASPAEFLFTRNSAGEARTLRNTSTDLRIPKKTPRLYRTFSELSTLLKEIQAVLNDRPLTYINSDIHDLQPLTPSQLLFGYNTTPLPYPPYDVSEPSDPTFGDKNDILRAQTHRSALYHHFSSRFCKEYLSFLCEIHSLHHRKEATNENLINVGDVVLVADMNKP